MRRLGEETTKTSAQAAAIALQALNSITGAKLRAKTLNGEDSEGSAEKEILLGPQTLDARAASLKTMHPSRIIKISGVFDREALLSVEQYEELKDDFEAEMQHIGQLRTIRVVRSGEERLGAEVGSIFVEFKDIRGAQLGMKKVKGRIYDGSEIKCVFIDEDFY